MHVVSKLGFCRSKYFDNDFVEVCTSIESAIEVTISTREAIEVYTSTKSSIEVELR